MNAGANAILSIVDSAPVFVDVVEDPARAAEAIRKFGLAELDAAIALVRASEGEARGQVLSGAAQRLGQLGPPAPSMRALPSRGSRRGERMWTDSRRWPQSRQESDR